MEFEKSVSQPTYALAPRDDGLAEDCTGLTAAANQEALDKFLDRQIKIPPVSINYFALFRYARPEHLCLLAVSAFFAIVAGATFPLLTVIIGNISQVLKGYLLGTVSDDELRYQVNHSVLYIVYIFIVQLVSVFIFTMGTLVAGEAITDILREKYVHSLFKQNLAFFDSYGSGKIVTQITSNTATVQDAISHKIGLFVSACSCFVTAYVIGFIKHWKLTFILTSTVVAISAVMAILAHFMGKYEEKSSSAIAEISGRVEEIFGGIRVVKSLGIETRLADGLEPHFQKVLNWSTKARYTLGWMLALIFGLIFLNYGLAIWQGNQFMIHGTGDVGAIITVLLALNVGAFFFGNVGPQIQSMIAGVAAALELFAIIDRQSTIDPDAPGTEPHFDVEGEIRFEHVSHVFPSRREVEVIKDFTMVFPPRKTSAIVGTSGCGKSTLVSLLMRFYEPSAGKIYLDSHDISNLNVHWLREQIGLVSQDATLFDGSIFQNVAYGLESTSLANESREVQMKLVVDACMLANAHEFIESLPNGYDQEVGIRGASLSGGQKQRIAIARAIVADPQILLLDEATSALDVKAEKAVQLGLNAAATGRTTIIIAHRLSTIKKADNIIVMSAGKVVEQGTHNSLLAAKGPYHNFARLQELKSSSPLHGCEITRAVAKPQDLAGSQTTRPHQMNPEAVLDAHISTANHLTSEWTTDSYSLWQIVSFIAAFNKEDWALMATGTISAIIAGCMWPVHSIFFAKSIVALSFHSGVQVQTQRGANFWAAMYVMLAFVQILSQGIQGSAYAICSERLILRARRLAFRCILRQDVVFFDDSGNSSGILTSFVTSDVKVLSGLSGVFLGTVFSAVATVLGGLVLGLVIGWKLTLVSMVTIPIIMVSGYFRLNLVGALEKITRRAYEQSAGHVCEQVNAIQTVAALGLERRFWQDYIRRLHIDRSVYLRATFRSSVLYAFSDALPFACMALGFWYGGNLVINGEYTTEQFFICIMAVIFGATSAGLVFAYAPDFSQASMSATRLKGLVSRSPKIDCWSSEGDVVKDAAGEFRFSDVSFSYATRPERPALSSINLDAPSGGSIAFCGPSGSGKSTIIALAERFYDVNNGSVTFDGANIRSLNLNGYRAQIALVSQDPLLFSGSLRENLLLGSLDNDATEADLIESCKMANIWDFVASLPEGLETLCGSNAVLLSGGQKQRLSIARALLRKPKALLLDEATSALDSDSETAVQTALRQASQGRTNITIAHRLSTIQSCDRIYFIQAGRIVEEGTHEELMGKRGVYYDSVTLQSLDANMA